MNIASYLGTHIDRLLGDSPFYRWRVKREVEEDLDEVRTDYVFPGQGLSVICDDGELISTIFLHSDEYGGLAEPVFEIPLTTEREAVLEHFGAPSKSGEESIDPILGSFGRWDRFDRSDVAIHVEYFPGSDRIRRVTLMRPDVAP